MGINSLDGYPNNPTPAAHRTRYLPYDVGHALRLPAVRSRLAERILPEADLHRVLSLETNPRNRAILTLLYASGMRVSEVCSLCWRDLRPNSVHDPAGAGVGLWCAES